jgi:hypothetical protein
MGFQHARRALLPAICCLVIAGCNDGSPSGAPGAPPGQNAPGAPAGNGGGNPGAGGGGDQGGGGGHVPVGPYKVPNIVIQAGTVYPDLNAWHSLENGFWSACPGGSHCVTPVPTLVDATDNDYPGCAMVGIYVDGVRITEVGTPLKMGSTIVVSFKRPCPGLEGGGDGGDGGGSPASSEPPPSEAPATGEPDTP